MVKLSREARKHVDGIRLWLLINNIPGLLIPADVNQEPIAMEQKPVKREEAEREAAK